MRTVYNKFSRGIWIVLEEGETYYIYYQKHGSLPQLMLIIRGRDTFTAFAECTELMYSLLHPEVMWSEQLQETIKEVLKAPGE